MLRILFIYCLLVSLPALEIVGEPAEYLQTSIRPEWSMARIHDVHDEIQKRIRIPFEQSTTLNHLVSMKIVFSSRSNISIKECLETLERIYDLRYTSKKLHLFVETNEDYKDRQRKVVEFNAADYLVFGNTAARDFPGLELAYSGGAYGGGASLFADAGFDDEDTVKSSFDLLGELVDQDNEQNLYGNMLYVRATKEEAKQVERGLRLIYDLNVRRKTFKITMGTLDITVPIKGGQVSNERLQQISKQLKDVDVFMCSAFNGQTVNRNNVDQEAYLFDYDIQTGSGGIGALDPQVRIISHGKTVQLSYTEGANYSLLDLQTQWAEKLDKKRVTFKQLPRMGKGETGEGEATVQNRKLVNGLEGAVDLFKRWRWATHEQIFYQGKLNFIIHALDGQRRTVVTVEEVEK